VFITRKYDIYKGEKLFLVLTLPGTKKKQNLTKMSRFLLVACVIINHNYAEICKKAKIIRLTGNKPLF